MKMTFHAYDQMLERFGKMDVKPYYPDPAEMDEMEKDPDKFICFACYLYEKGETPVSKSEEYSRRNLKDFISKHLELTDDGSVIIEARSEGNGAVSIDKTEYQPGEQITVTAVPDPGYRVSGAKLLDGMFGRKILGTYGPELSIQAPDMDAVIIVSFRKE